MKKRSKYRRTVFPCGAIVYTRLVARGVKASYTPTEIWPALIKRKDLLKVSQMRKGSVDFFWMGPFPILSASIPVVRRLARYYLRKMEER